jgi:hypothetical protein
MLDDLINLLEAAGWPLPVMTPTKARWSLPQWGMVHDRFFEVKEMADGSLLLIKHAIGGISGGSFTSADSLFRFLLPYTDIVTA